jgi:CheY-like chemotaxis protein
MATTTNDNTGRSVPGGLAARLDTGQLRILVVDDMRSNRTHTRSMLSGQGYRIEEAANGVEAIKTVACFRPHIILMNIVMPEMDGITCCRKLKEGFCLSYARNPYDYFDLVI